MASDAVHATGQVALVAEQVESPTMGAPTTDDGHGGSTPPHSAAATIELGSDSDEKEKGDGPADNLPPKPLGKPSGIASAPADNL